MGVNETILGGEERLRESILEVDDIYRPKLIFVAITCCAGVTKEPVEEIVEELKSKVKAKLMDIRAEGFTWYSHGIAHNYLSREFSKLFEEPQRKIPNSINILGIAKEIHHPGNFPTDSHELTRLLSKMGVKVNSVLLQSASLESFQKAPEASFNTFDCPQWGFEMAKAMKERFGIPYGKRFNPLGVTAISNWLREVGEFFGLEKETDKVIEEEYKQIKEVWEEAKRLVKGKMALIDGADPMGIIGRGTAWARMCEDLGMKAIIFNLSPIDIKGVDHHVSFALGEGYDPHIVYSDHAYHRRFSPLHIIKGLGFDIRDVGIYIGDVFPRIIGTWDKPIFDDSNVPRITTTIHCSRQRESPGRRSGFRGAERFAMDVITAVNMAKRGNKPTLTARLRSL